MLFGNRDRECRRERKLTNVTSAAKRIEDLLTQSKDLYIKSQVIISLTEKYPDLEVDIDRWKKERFLSKSINTIATECEIDHTCGCCPDAVLRVSPYVIDSDTGIRIFTSPRGVEVGEMSYDGDDRLYNDWQDRLIKCGYDQKVIDSVWSYISVQKSERLKALQEEMEKLNDDRKV